MQFLTIAIDPQISRLAAAPIFWAWQTVLTGIGYAWREGAYDQPADIAYGITAPPIAPRLFIRCHPERWEAPRRLHLDGLIYSGPWVLPRYSAGVPGDYDVAGYTIGRDLIFDCYWLLAGCEEPVWPQDRHGHLDLTGSPWVGSGILRAAPVSAIATALAARLAQAGLPPPLPRWPYGKVAAAAASHDVDYPEVIRWLEPLRVLQRQGRGRRACRQPSALPAGAGITGISPAGMPSRND